jgi:hypothetical protein
MAHLGFDLHQIKTVGDYWYRKHEVQFAYGLGFGLAK